jgi:hypothetical protein
MMRRFVIGTSLFGSGCAATWAYYNYIRKKETRVIQLPVISVPTEVNKARDILAHGPHGFFRDLST